MFEAINLDDFSRATLFLNRAKIDEDTIAIVLKTWPQRRVSIYKTDSSHHNKGLLMMKNQEMIKDLLRSSGGSLKLFGRFWGRPFDDFREIDSVEDRGSHIVVHFKTYSSNKDSLVIWNPSGVEITDGELRLRSADKIIHTWETEPVSVGSRTVNSQTCSREYRLKQGKLYISSSFEPDEVADWNNEPAFELVKS